MRPRFDWIEVPGLVSLPSNGGAFSAGNRETQHRRSWWAFFRLAAGNREVRWS